MAFTLDPQTGKITFGVVADSTHDAIARDIASEFGVSETFKDNFSINAGWITTDSAKVDVNTTNGVIDFTVVRDGTNDAIAFDLGAGNVSDTSWVLRYKLQINQLNDGTNVTGFIGISDTDQATDYEGPKDFLGTFFTQGTSVKAIGSVDINNGNMQAGQNASFSTQTSVTTFYVEIVRDSATGMTMRLFSDASYSVLLEENSEVISASISGLRFLLVQGITSPSTTATAVVEIADVQFWNGITVPVITSPNWRLRFELDITGLTTPSGADVSMWIGMGDEDATSGSNNPQDGFFLTTFVDSILNFFRVQTADNQAPRNAGSDAQMTEVPAVDTYFIEMTRDSLSQTTVRFYTDNTFTTVLESKTQAGISGTDNLKYLKLFNDEVPTNDNKIDGTIDNITFDDLSAVVITEKEFIVDAILELIDQEKTFEVDALIQSQGTCASQGVLLFDPIGGNSGLWTSNTGAIVIDSGGSGVLEWNSLQGGATTNERFAFRTIPNFADDIGELRIRVKVNKIADSSPTNPSGHFMVLQNNNLHPNPSTGSSFEIGIGGGSPNGSIFVNISDGTNGVSTLIRPTFLNGTTRFLEGIYDPVAQTITLNVFTDADYTVHEAGSPYIDDASTISMTGLTFTHMITSNIKNSGPARIITADLDDFQIGGGSCPSIQVDALIQSLGDNGCTFTTFFDTITSATPWTEVDPNSQLIVNDTAGVIEYNSLQMGANNFSTYAHRSIPSFSDNVNSIELKIKVDNQITSFNSPTPILMQIQEGTADPFQATGSRMEISLSTSFGAFARIRDGTNLATTSSISFVEGTTRFLRATFDPATQILTMNVYTDANFTIHDTGSPVQVSTSSLTFTGVTTFDTITTGAKFNDGSARVITADLDDFTVIHGGCPSFSVDALIKAQGVNLCTAQLAPVIFTQSSGFDANWITQGDSSINVSASNVFFVPNTDGDNDAVARDLSDPSALGQLVSDTEFELVYSINFIGLVNGSVPFINGNAVQIGLSSQDQTVSFQTGGSDDALFVRVLNQQFPSSGALQLPRWQLFYKDGSGLVGLASSNDNPNDNPILGTQWVKMERLSATTVRMIVATDSAFTNVRFDSGILAIPSTVGGLRYIKCTDTGIVNIQPAQVNGSFDNITLTTIAVNDCFQVDAIIVENKFTCGDKVIFEDDFATNTNWVQTGTQVTITGGEIQGWGADSTDQRVTHDLVTPLDDKGWTAEFEYEFSASANPAHDIFVLTDTNSTSSALQDHIACRFGFSGGLIQFGLLHGGAGQIGTGSIMPITASINTRYFVRLQRISPFLARLTVFTGGFDSVLFGTIDVDLSLFGGPPTGLQFVQSQTSDLGGAGRTLTGIIDNLVITNVCCVFEVDALIQAKGDNGVCGVSLSNLKAYWTFNETSGLLVNNADVIGSVDSLGTSADGTVGGSINRSQLGQVGDSYRFDGLTESQVGNRITIGSSTSQFNFMHTPNSKGTFNFWINPKSASQAFADIFINQNNSGGNTGFLIAIASGKIQFRPRAPSTELLSTVSTTNGITPNVLTMVTVVWDETTGADIYFNGVFEENFPRAVNTASSANANFPLTIGTRSDTQAGVTLDAFLDEATAWDRKLTAGEIGNIFALNSNGQAIQEGGQAVCIVVDALIQSKGDNGTCSGTTYMDDMSSGSNWVTTDAGRMSITGTKLFASAIADATNDTISTDLSDPSRLGTTLSDSFFRVRFSINFTTVGQNSNFNHLFFYLSDKDSSINAGIGSEDAIGLHAQIGGPPTQSIVGMLKDSSSFKTQVFFVPDPLSTGISYYEIIRNGTTVTYNNYSDASFTTLVNTAQQTAPASITGLKYFKVGNWQFGNSANVFDCLVDDLDVLSAGSSGSVACAEVDAVLVGREEFIVDALLSVSGEVLCAGGQGIFFQEDFTTNTGWTNNDTTRIRIDDVTFPDVLRIVNLHPTTQGLKRAFKALTTPFSPDTDFIWEFKHIHFAGGTSSASEWKIELKETSADAGAGSSATETTIRYRTDVIPTSGPERLELQVADNNGSNFVKSTEGAIVLQDNFTYFPRITKTGTIVKLELFTDVDRTTQETGSPVQVDTTGFDMSQELGFIYTGNFSTGGPARVANEEVDDIIVQNSTCPRFQVDAILKALGQEHEFFVNALVFELPVALFTVSPLIQSIGTCGGDTTVLFDQIAGNSGLWTSNSSQIVIDSGGSGIVEMNSLVGGGTTTSRRAFRSLDQSFPANVGKITMRQKVTHVSGNIETGIFMAIQEGTGDASLALPQPRILLAFGSGSPPGLFAQIQDGAGGIVSTPQPQIVIADGVTQFVETIYDPLAQTLTLNSFSDAGFSIPVAGSPLVVDTSSINMPATLIDTVVSSNFTNSGTGRIITADLDDYQVIIGGCPTFQVDACLEVDLSKEFIVDACLGINGGEEDFFVDALVFILPVRNFAVNAIIRYAQGSFVGSYGAIPDLIIRVLKENPPSLEGTEIVDEINKITSDPAEGFPFVGKTSRIKNWLNRLRLDGLILNDDSNPDWYRTNWSLNPAVFP